MTSVTTDESDGIDGLWAIWMSIFTWMAVSYAVVHLVAFLVALISLRHHPWAVLLSSPFLVMAVIGPLTLGALTSGSIALPFAIAGKSISVWYCMLFGCGQTALVVVTSFSRIMATL